MSTAKPSPESPVSGGNPIEVVVHSGFMLGWQTLLYKEVLRFWKVAFQTVAAPVLTSVLYMLIFGHVLEDHVKVYDHVAYTSFLLPGLIMMGVLLDSFRWSRRGDIRWRGRSYPARAQREVV